jgi:hypothetical protein
MTVIVLALVGLLVFVVTISPPSRTPGEGSEERAGATSTPTPRPPLTDPNAFDVTATLSTTPDAKPKTIDAEIGDRVQLTVDGTVLDAVAVGDLAMKSVEPDVSARFEILADTAGSYPVVLVNENRRIGTLEVR